MWKKISLIALCLAIFTFIWLVIDQKENENTAFNYAKEYVENQYNENGNLTNGGTRYDVGRGNYSVILRNGHNNKYYLEVKLSNDLTLVSVEGAIAGV